MASGIDVRTVAGRLGHRNPATTLNVYSHFVPEADQQAAEALGQLFGEAMKAAAENVAGGQRHRRICFGNSVGDFSLAEVDPETFGRLSSAGAD